MKIVIDPDNVFWAIVRKKGTIPREVIALYKRVKDRLDEEFRNFRFSTDLAAVYIDPTSRCNANCPYCYIPANIRRNGRTMTRGELIFILEKIASYKRKIVIVFHASEPLIVKDTIFEVIERFKKQFKFGLQTNAILLKRQDVEFLKKHRVGVGISLDSSSKYLNNRLRGGNFDNAIKAIEWFDGYSGLNVITTVTKLNVKELPHMVKFLYKKKVPCVLLNPVRLTQESSRALRPDEDILAKYFIKAVDESIRLSQQSSRRIIIGNFANIILGIIAPTARRLMCDISPCGGGRCFFTITASGEMIPCGEFIGLKGFSGGNIFKDSINKAIMSVPFKQIRSRIVERIDECATCILRNICGAPCPAELHSLGNMYPVRDKAPKVPDGCLWQPVSNGMYKKAVFCNFYKEIIEYAFKLLAEKKERYLLRQDSFQYEYRLF